jgi:hypothetical protein
MLPASAAFGVSTNDPRPESMVAVANDLRAGASPTVATFRFRAQYEALARALVKNGLGSTYIRISPEAQGHWSATQYGPNVAAWRQYFRNIVLSMRAAPGQHFQFAWNMGNAADTRNLFGGVVPMNLAYPGDDVVDVVGPDFYDGNFNGPPPLPNEYPAPCPKYEPTTCGVTRAQQLQAWASYYVKSDPAHFIYGLDWWAAFAQRHGKRVILGEWGLSQGGDDVFFLRQVRRWIDSHNVAYASYFDYDGRASQDLANLAAGRSKLSPATVGGQGRGSAYLKAPCAYLQEFGGAGAAKAFGCAPRKNVGTNAGKNRNKRKP